MTAAEGINQTVAQRLQKYSVFSYALKCRTCKYAIELCSISSHCAISNAFQSARRAKDAGCREQKLWFPAAASHLKVVLPKPPTAAMRAATMFPHPAPNWQGWRACAVRAALSGTMPLRNGDRTRLACNRQRLSRRSLEAKADLAVDCVKPSFRRLVRYSHPSYSGDLTLML